MKDIEFPLHSKDWKKFEQNNRTIALNILFVSHNTKQIRQAYISKYNHESDNQVILLMIIDDDEDRHYLAVKSIKIKMEIFTVKIVFIHTEQRKT